jgi:hypothetical protein
MPTFPKTDAAMEMMQPTTLPFDITEGLQALNRCEHEKKRTIWSPVALSLAPFEGAEARWKSKYFVPRRKTKFSTAVPSPRLLNRAALA